MEIQEIQVCKADLSKSGIVTKPAGELGTGEILAKIDRFALTANNVTYGVVGEKIGYWNFILAAENANGIHGIIPVWGFADVVESNVQRSRQANVCMGISRWALIL